MKDTVTETAGVNLIHEQIRKEVRGLNSKRMRRIMPPHQWSAWLRLSKPKGCIARGAMNRSIIATKVIDGVEHTFHATKGRRSKRLAAA